MASHYEIDKERRLIISTASGVITLPEVWAHQERLAKDPDFDPSFAQLLDVTQVTKLKLSSEDVRRVAESNTLSTNPRLAIVATSSLVYGMARMFQIFREMKGEEKTRVFRDRDEALAWALGKDEAD
jgi:hypothetical protein